MHRIRTRLSVLLLAASVLLPAAASAKTLEVVATLPDLAWVASQVGGEHVRVRALSLATQDPHFVDARPNLAVALARADVLLVAGLELELGWLPTLLTGSRNPTIRAGGAGYVDCSVWVERQEVPEAPIDRSMGDIHPGGNPHYYLDPRAMRRVVLGVADRFAGFDPAHAEAYAAHAAATVARIDAATARWEEAAAGLRGAPVVTYHRSWPYLADWLGLDVVIELEPKPGIPPSPQHVARVLSVATERQAKALLMLSYYPDRSAKLVTDKAGMALIKVNGGSNFASGEDWIEFMDGLVASLVAAGGEG
jgi:zinc/manganese transport system substrate-binding protein